MLTYKRPTPVVHSTNSIHSFYQLQSFTRPIPVVHF